MSEAPCRIAVVGLGKVARDQHLPAIAMAEQFTLAATVDPASEGVEGALHFATLAQLAASGVAFDAVSLCSPPQFRHALAREAVAAGKHVLLEKPPGATMAEAESLRSAAQSAGLTSFAAWHSRYSAGVAPARAWLAGKAVRSVAITWREDVRVWHPGQDWIWREGGFGVFDPGINALSIATAILPNPLEVTGGALQFPANCAAPVSGQVNLTDTTGMPVTLDLDFLQQGPQTWDIRVETYEGELLLSLGGSMLTTTDGTMRAADRDYPALYAHFAQCLADGTSEADLAPLDLVSQALARCTVDQVAPFHE
ncbi:Gfo/Idh/MocA family oxidoreductase [Altererythrobacter sp. KTW20L]|uniref:Gfo/Idh/MocA family protein n=1 Tax=Altererythrobacter sp. KTW20L TaxID=2942210 RepID=UPI0020BF8B6C|nr:Gfo/Idh/MocA family oxidoreductase [Altererythrobacter sp. KTW20L]MCL6251517.1 Gfo/Idh/MocA family oxidoreductase [Altererythrobacter sp. KTW20L]